jgi:hypothetical protein
MLSMLCPILFYIETLSHCSNSYDYFFTISWKYALKFYFICVCNELLSLFFAHFYKLEGESGNSISFTTFSIISIEFLSLFMSSLLALSYSQISWPLCSPKTAQWGHIRILSHVTHTISNFFVWYRHILFDSVIPAYSSKFLNLKFFIISDIVIFVGSSLLTFLRIITSLSHY